MKCSKYSTVNIREVLSGVVQYRTLVEFLVFLLKKNESLFILTINTFFHPLTVPKSDYLQRSIYGV
jgi:hypothetical protein